MIGTVHEGVSITLDHRESSSTLGPYLRSLGVQIQFSHLLNGDIRISERILIERKTARDLVQSLTDGRLLHQCRRLVAASSRPMLLIEIGQGHGQFVHPDAVHGALAHVSLDLGIPIMMTKSAEESAHFLAAAAKREHDMIERMATSALKRAERLRTKEVLNGQFLRLLPKSRHLNSVNTSRHLWRTVGQHSKPQNQLKCYRRYLVLGQRRPKHSSRRFPLFPEYLQPVSKN